jgi:hypothetical protein
METSFFTGFGHFCRFIIIAVIAVTSINATLSNVDTLSVRDTTTTNGPLSNFRGETTKYRKVELKWQSIPGTSVTYTIQKSRDGENFAEVETKKIVSVNSDYSWVDEYPKTTNCYRLKITDAEGKVSYSKSLVIQVFKTGQVSMISATPDISVNDIDIDVKTKELAIIGLYITDKSGAVVMHQTGKAYEGLNQYTVKGSHDLKSGDYFLRVVVNGTDALMVKLIKE